MGKSRKYTDKEFIQAVKTSLSIRQVLQKIGLRPAGGNYKTVKQRIKQFNLDTKHWQDGRKRQGWAKGKKFPNRPKTPLKDILVSDSSYQSNKLRKRLIKENIFEERCYNCGLTEWQGYKIPLELEHKNGNNRDHRIDNLTLLCPNCHAFTDTYRGRNK